MDRIRRLLGLGNREDGSDETGLPIRHRLDLEALSTKLAEHYLSERSGSLEKNQEIQSRERELFQAVASDPRLRAAIPKRKDVFVEVRRIYMALCMAGAGQRTQRGWVPLLAVTNPEVLKRLYKQMKGYEFDQLPEPSERIKDAAWETLRFFR